MCACVRACARARVRARVRVRPVAWQQLPQTITIYTPHGGDAKELVAPYGRSAIDTNDHDILIGLYLRTSNIKVLDMQEMCSVP